jgi:hypothetical protein
LYAKLSKKMSAPLNEAWFWGFSLFGNIN